MKSSWWRELWETLVTVLVMLAIVFAVRYFVVEPFKVDGHSMDYTLADGERLLMWKPAKIERFDVVVLQAPDNPEKLYIKRVIGVPGDTVEVKDGVMTINGKAVEEPYLAEKIAEKGAHFTADFTLESVAGAKVVPEGKLFVLGDNRMNSKDGRAFGFIDKSLIKGEADVILWPMNKWGLLTKYELNDSGQIVPR